MLADYGVKDLWKRRVLSLEWNSECDGGWELWAGGRWIRECDIIIRVFYARLTEWDRKLSTQKSAMALTVVGIPVKLPLNCFLQLGHLIIVEIRLAEVIMTWTYNLHMMAQHVISRPAIRVLSFSVRCVTVLSPVITCNDHSVMTITVPVCTGSRLLIDSWLARGWPRPRHVTSLSLSHRWDTARWLAVDVLDVIVVRSLWIYHRISAIIIALSRFIRNVYHSRDCNGANIRLQWCAVCRVRKRIKATHH